MTATIDLKALCISELDKMQEGADQEIAHGRADDLLCDYLRAIDQGEIAEAFEGASERVGFWYA